MRRKTITLIVFSVALALYVVFLAWSIYEHQRFLAKAEEAYRGTFVEPYITFPRWSDRYGSAAMMYGMLLGMLFVLVLVFKGFGISRKCLVALVMTGLLGLTLAETTYLMPTEIVPKAYATSTPVDVNVLLYYDEEHTGYGSIIGWLTQSDGSSVYDMFKNDYGIVLNVMNIHFDTWHGWQYETWSSNNNIYSAEDLLQDAVRTHGGVWDPIPRWATRTELRVGWWYLPSPNPYLKDGKYYSADLIIFVTNQAIDIGVGLSVPQWNSILIKNFPTKGELLHEISHQFGAEHCSNWCSMNPNYACYISCWCGNCASTINQNREEFGYKEWITINSAPGGQTNPVEGQHQRIKNEYTTISASVDFGYMFYKWTVRFGLYEYTEYYQNPLIINVTRPFGVYEVLIPAPNPGGYGAGGGGWRAYR